MTGRGIDRILPHPSPPDLYERWVQHADDYVVLAERRHGAIPRPVRYDYVWGDALAELVRQRPHVRLINLETAITRSGPISRHKGIHYRMHPDNLPCLTAAGSTAACWPTITCWTGARRACWTRWPRCDAAGLPQRGRGARRGGGGSVRRRSSCGGTARAGFRLRPAARAACQRLGRGPRRPGVNCLGTCSARSAARMVADESLRADAGRLGSWCRCIGAATGATAFPRSTWLAAHRLVDEAGVDVVHGHSSHHPLAVEVHHGRLVIYGCGDLLNDYEGIRGYEAFRGDLTAMYFPVLDAATGELRELLMCPMQIRRLRLNRCHEADVRWMAARLTEQGRRFSVAVEVRDGRLLLSW